MDRGAGNSDVTKRLTQDLNSAGVATDRAASGNDRLAESHQRVSVSTDRHRSALSRLRSALTGVSGVAGRLGSLFTVLSKVNLARLLGQVGKLGALLAAASIAGLGLQAGLTGIVGLAGGLAATVGVVGLLPAVLAAAVSAFAALKIGFSGFGDALKSVGADQETFNKAIKGLAPAAQDVLRQLRALKPAFDALRLDVQQRLFSGLATTVGLLGQRYLPLLRNQLTGIADGFNKAFRDTGNFLLLPTTTRDLASSFENIKVGINNALGALQPFVAALVNLVQVGSTFLPRLGAALADEARQFDVFIRKARESGKLDQFIERGIQALKNLGHILANLGSALAGVFRAAESASGGFLNSTEKATKTLANIINSVRGQNALKSFFEGAGEAVTALKPVFVGLLDVLGQVGPIIGDIGTQLGPVVGELLTQLAGALSNMRSGLDALAKGFASVGRAFAPVLPLLGEAVGLLAGTVGRALSAIATPLSNVGVAFAGVIRELSKAVRIAVPGLADLIGGFANVVSVVAPVIPLFGEAANVIGTALGGALKALAPSLNAAGVALATVFKQLGPAITAAAPGVGKLVTALADMAIALAPLLPQLGELVGLLASALADAVVAVTPFLGDLIVAFKDFVANALPGLIEGFRSAVAVMQPFLAVLGPLGHLLGDIARILGPFAPLILAAVAAWVALSGAVRAAETALKVFKTVQRGIKWSGFADDATTSFRKVEKEATKGAEGTKRAWQGSFKAIGLAAAGFVAGEVFKSLGKPLDPGITLDTASTKEKFQDLSDSVGKILTFDVSGVFEKLERDLNNPSAFERLSGPLSESFSNLWKGITATADASLSGPLATTTQAALGQLVPIVNQTVQDIAGLFTNLSPLVQASLVQLPPVMQGAANAAVGGMVPIIELGMQNIVAPVVAVTPQMQEALAPLLPVMQQSVGAAMGGLLPIVNTGVANITTAIAQVPPLSVGALATLPADVAGPVSAAMGGLLPIVQDGVRGITDQVRGLPPSAEAALGALPASVQNPMNQAMRGLFDATNTGVNNAASAAGALPGRTTAAVGNMSGTLAPAGNSAMSGFYNSMIGFYNRTIAPWLSSLANKIASLKGPLDKDRRILIPAGNAIMEGLNQGLRAGLEPVLRTAEQTAGLITSQMESGLPAITAAIRSLIEQAASSARLDLGALLEPALSLTSVGSAAASAATGRAVGTGTPGQDLSGLVEAFAAAINNAQLVAKGSDLTMIVNGGNRDLARRR